MLLIYHSIGAQISPLPAQRFWVKSQMSEICRHLWGISRPQLIVNDMSNLKTRIHCMSRWIKSSRTSVLLIFNTHGTLLASAVNCNIYRRTEHWCANTFPEYCKRATAQMESLKASVFRPKQSSPSSLFSIPTEPERRRFSKSGFMCQRGNTSGGQWRDPDWVQVS